MPLALLSLFFVSLLGLGAAFFAKDFTEETVPPWLWYVAGAVGLSVSQTWVLLGTPVSFSVYFTLAAGLVAWAGIGFRRWRRGVRLLPPWTWTATGLSAITLLPAFNLLADSVTSWDGKSIWFFHGKILYYADSLRSAPWRRPELDFTHVDYPKLAALFSAQVGRLLGLWNDYWPKASLLFLLLLAQVGTASVPLRPRGKVGLWLVLVSLSGYFLWTGFMDAYLALYGFLAAVFLGLSLENPGRETLFPALASLAVMMGLKNEGTVAALILAALFLLRGAGTFAQLRDGRVLLLFLPAVLWAFFRRAEGIQNDLSSQFDWARVQARIGDAGFWRTLLHFARTKTHLDLALPLFLGWSLWRRPRGAGYWLSLGGFTGYLGTVILVYLSTYWEVGNHLNASLDRVSFLPLYLLVSATFFSLRGATRACATRVP